MPLRKIANKLRRDGGREKALSDRVRKVAGYDYSDEKAEEVEARLRNMFYGNKQQDWSASEG